MKIIPKVLQTYKTVKNTILLYASYLQPLKKYGTIVSIKNLFLLYSLLKKFKFCKLEKSTKNLIQMVAKICIPLRYTEYILL